MLSKFSEVSFQNKLVLLVFFLLIEALRHKFILDLMKIVFNFIIQLFR